MQDCLKRFARRKLAQKWTEEVMSHPSLGKRSITRNSQYHPAREELRLEVDMRENAITRLQKNHKGVQKSVFFFPNLGEYIF
jgi:hypothetical protein